MASMRPERAYSPAARASVAPDPSRVLIIGCGALARELVAVIDQAGLANVDLTCLPATLHNRPGGIPAAVRARIRAARPRYERIFIAYADCGTGGLLDLVLADEGVERLPGAHCYEFYSGPDAFAAMSEEDPATFYLTDFLARNFDRLVITGLGLDRHPELLPAYFGNYHRLVYLAQTEDAALIAAARRAARRLGLTFELRPTGYGELATGLVAAARPAVAARAAARSGAMPAGEATGATAAGAGPTAAARTAPALEALASGASTVAAGTLTATSRADSLRSPQEAAPRPPAGVVDVRPEHSSRRRPPGSRRMLLQEQRGGGLLHGRQRTAASGPAAAIADATSPATTASGPPAALAVATSPATAAPGLPAVPVSKVAAVRTLPPGTTPTADPR